MGLINFYLDKPKKMLIADLFETDFNSLVTEEHFIDKTPFIKEVIECEHKGILITAPNGLGKTANLNMLETFLQLPMSLYTGQIYKVDKDFFRYQIYGRNNLKIYQQRNFFESHFAKYPVLNLDFKSIFGDSLEEIIEKIRILTNETFTKYSFLLNSTKLSKRELAIFENYYNWETIQKLSKKTLSKGFGVLAKCLYKHCNFTKIFVLIDNYDTPISHVLFKENFEVREIVRIINQIFSNITHKKHVEKAVIMGLFSYNVTSRLSVNSFHIEAYPFMVSHQFKIHFGVTHRKLDKLLDRYDIDEELREEVEDYYGPYFSQNGEMLFPLRSILEFLRTKRMEIYYEESNPIYSGIMELFSYEHYFKFLEKLCLFQPFRYNIQKQLPSDLGNSLKNPTFPIAKNATFDLFSSFLIQLGYLTYRDPADHPEEERKVKIVNREIANLLQNDLINLCAIKYKIPDLDFNLRLAADTFKRIKPSCKDETVRKLIVRCNWLLREAQETDCVEEFFQSMLYIILIKANFSINETEDEKTDLFLYNENTDLRLNLKKHRKICGNNKRKDLENSQWCYLGINVNKLRKVDVIFARNL